MSLKTLLDVLADGQFHSGDKLGSAIGVSRTAVWKQLKKVEDLGLPLISVKGRGYCIEGGLNPLRKDLIESLLSPAASAGISSLAIEGVVGSTNELAMREALRDCTGHVCTAEQQLAGKGRRGRKWLSPYGANLYFSIVWRFAGGAASLEGLSLAVGVAVVQGLERLGIAGAQLKWPNDVLFQGRKLAGVLLEMTGDAAGPCQVVVGVGLNVNMPPASKVAIDQPWVDASSAAGTSLDRNRVLAYQLNEIIPLLGDFEQTGFAAYRDRWQMLDAYAGQDVFIKLGDDMVAGTEQGVDSAGAIVVSTANGRRVFNGGEVSLRLGE